MSKVKNPKLAGEGEAELAWARENMPIIAHIRKEFERTKPLKGLTASLSNLEGKAFKGLRIGVALHLEKKTGILLETLQAGGAKVTAASCNPMSTDDKVAAALAKEMDVFAWAGQTNKEYYWCLDQVLKSKPQIIIDDGCDLTLRTHQKYKELIPQIKGACEETTTGVLRLRAMARDKALRFPVFSVNDAYAKYLFDNRFGTGQSTIDAISRATNKLIAGKTIAVLGYGWCGKGIAKRLAGLGANVIVTEVSATLGNHESGFHRGLEALYEGYRVMSIEQAAPLGDVFITATGNIDVIRGEHFRKMKSGAILCNAGHFDNEISKKDLAKLSRRRWQVKENVEGFELAGGKKLYLLSEGRLVNLARPSGQGHPIEIMDGSFSIQALCVRQLATKPKMKPGVYPVPVELDDLVARLALETQGIRLTKPTPEQLKYAEEWREGT